MRTQGRLGSSPCFIMHRSIVLDLTCLPLFTTSTVVNTFIHNAQYVAQIPKALTAIYIYQGFRVDEKQDGDCNPDSVSGWANSNYTQPVGKKVGDGQKLIKQEKSRLTLVVWRSMWWEASELLWGSVESDESKARPLTAVRALSRGGAGTNPGLSDVMDGVQTCRELEM